MKTRTQLRSICSICGKTHALKDNRLVAHGYTVDYGYFNGSCFGTGAPHLGSDQAPAFIEKTIQRLSDRIEIIPSRIAEAESEVVSGLKEKRAQSRKIQTLKAEKSGLEYTIKVLKDRLENWTAFDPILVDLDVEEAEERKARQAAAAEKAAEKAKKEAEKAARQAAAAEKAAQKMEILLSAETYRQIKLDGEIVLEWREGFDSVRAMFDKLREKADEIAKKEIESGRVTLEDVLNGALFIESISRTGSGKKGRQLEKVSGYRFFDL